MSQPLIEAPPPPPRRGRRRPTRVPWTKQGDEHYLQATWRYQRGLVRLLMVPAPFMLAVMIYWRIEKLAGYPPLWVFAVFLGSVAFTLGTAFFFWRCPNCGYLLYRTSQSGASVLFWLSDPELCPDCGFPLKPNT